MQDGRGRGDEISAWSTGEREKDRQENTHGQRSDGVDGTPICLCVTHDCGVVCYSILGKKWYFLNESG